MLRRIGMLAIVPFLVFFLFSACGSSASIVSEQSVTGTVTQVKKHVHPAGKIFITKYHVFVQYENLSFRFHVSPSNAKNYKMGDVIAVCVVTKRYSDGSTRDELQKTCPHSKGN